MWESSEKHLTTTSAKEGRAQTSNYYLESKQDRKLNWTAEPEHFRKL